MDMGNRTRRSWAEEQAATRRRDFRRRARKLLVAYVVFATFIGTAMFWMLSWGLPGPINWIFLGAYPVGIAWSVHWMLGWDGTRSLRNGISAERQTSRLLANLNEEGWRSIDNFDLGGYDIDHILIGSHGVFAIETKYRSSLDKLTPAYLRRKEPRSLAQATKNAQALQSLLAKHGIRWVQPVLIFWGPTAGSLEPSHAKVGPVFVGAGPLHEEWLPALLASATLEVEVESVESAIEAA